MAIELVAEVVRYLSMPGCDLTDSERVALLAIAERANKTSREAWQGGRDEWSLGNIVKARLSDVLARLAKRGLDVRVVRCVDANGRPVYAHKGKQTTYRLPGLPTSIGSVWAEALTPVGSICADPYDSKGSAPAEQASAQTEALAPKGSAQPDPYPSLAFPSETSSSSYAVVNKDDTDGLAAAAADTCNDLKNPNRPRGTAAIAVGIVVEHTDATLAEADAVVAAIVKAKQPRALVGLVRRLAVDGELPDWLADIRAQRLPGTRAAKTLADGYATADECRTLPPCGHGTAGGRYRNHNGGGYRCPQCRADEAAAQVLDPTGRMAKAAAAQARYQAMDEADAQHAVEACTRLAQQLPEGESA